MNFQEIPNIVYFIVVAVIFIGSRVILNMINTKKSRERMNALKKDLQEVEMEMGDYTLKIDYSSLQSIGWLQQVPRELTPEVEAICNGIHPKPYSWAFWGGGIQGWRERMSKAPLSFIYVYQANTCLYDPEEARRSPAVVFATEDSRASDPKWMGNMGEHISRIIESGMVPYISELLANERSMFDTELPTEITGGIQFRMFVMFINPDELPGHCIEEKVLPALYSGKNDSYSWQIIPAKYYS